MLLSGDPRALEAMGSASPQNTLFQPLTIGTMTLSHRIAMAPLTRYRAEDNHAIMPMAQEYYERRARAVPGTLLLSEATVISPRAGGYPNIPAIWSQEQISAWKAVTTRVHRAGSYIFCQLIAFGRGADPKFLHQKGVGDFVSSSAVPSEKDAPVPRELSECEIQEYIQDFALAAQRAMEAGFDGVEIDAANGFLIDQFIQDTCNQRNDQWGGSIKNRSRLALEITKTVVHAIGSARTGIRMSPWSRFQGMKMEDPVTQFTHLIRGLRKLDIAYLHLITPRAWKDTDWEGPVERIDSLINVWGRTSPILLAGGFNTDTAQRTANEEFADFQVVVVFGRHFISNPDLAWRLRNGVELRKYDRGLFYYVKSPAGYTDYDFCEQWKAQNSN